jgi:hypothetical protein
LGGSISGTLFTHWITQHINNLHQLDKTHFSKSDDIPFTHLLHLLVAIQNHYTGHLDVALQYYSLIPAQAGDTYLLSLLNRSLILQGGTPTDRTTSQKLLDEVERRLLVMGNQHSGQLRTAWMFIRGATTHELLRSKYHPPLPLSLAYDGNADGSDLLTRVINICTDQMNMQLRILGLTLMSARYYINTNTITAEKTALMGYIGAQKSQDALWQLQGGKILAGQPRFSN